MIDLRPFKNIFITTLLLAPLGVWKAVEIIVWAFSRITWN